jgi:GntR family transcriptional regulator
LEVARDSRLFFVRRLRFADGAPVILERRFIVAGLCPRLNRRDLEGSLYGAWTSRHGLEITGANQSIRAANLSEEDAHLLGVKRGAAALLVLALGSVAGNKPLWWEETLYRADAYEFHCRLGGPQSSSSPIGQLRAKV